MRVFFDTNIFSESRSYNEVISASSVKWGDIEVTTEQSLFERADSKNLEHEALVEIGVHGRMAAFTAHQTRSVMLETIPQSRNAKNTIADALRDIKFENHPDIIDLSYFRTFTLADDLMKIKCSLTEAIRIAKSIPDKEMLRVFRALKINENFEDLASRMARVTKMAEVFDEKHWPDGFHYISAEHNGGDVFLTCDRKFRNYIKETLKYEGRCKALSPTELLEKLQSSIP